MKKVLLCGVALAFLCSLGIAGISLAEVDKGPADITMTGDAKKPKPAQFPHAKHQETLKCADCHHGMADGKQVPYAEDQKVEKCATCHNADKLAGKTVDVGGKKPLKLDTMKGAGHGNCKTCHTEAAKKDAKKKDLKKCTTCHPKKK
ncbi:MAG: cytochrome c3 family protein [Deltaproteobacteria bacterium]|nr:cytochrome c3 family protein [Deltaproteobacteria bacterium]